MQFDELMDHLNDLRLMARDEGYLAFAGLLAHTLTVASAGGIRYDQRFVEPTPRPKEEPCSKA